MKEVNILLVDRVNSSKYMGGDTVQINAIAEYLRKSNYNVHISSDICAFVNKHKTVDLIIFFNLTNPYELLERWYFIKDKGIPYIVFPIYWNLNKAIPYNAYVGLKSKVIHCIPYPLFNFIKWFSLLFKEKNWKKRCYYKMFFLRREIKSFLVSSKSIFVNSEAEKHHLVREFNIQKNLNIRIARNGIEEDFYRFNEEKSTLVLPFKEYICCAGGIGPRKNQMNLVKAANNTRVNLIIVGKPSKGTIKYYNAIKKVRKSNIEFIGHLNRKDLLYVLSNAKGHIQPSYIETPGLASLEAAALGCKIAVSDVGPVREYFSDLALYCDPSSVDSIRDCLLELWNKNLTESEREKQINFISRSFNWGETLKPFGEEVKNLLKR